MDMALSRLRSGREADAGQHDDDGEHGGDYDTRPADQEQVKQDEEDEESNLLVTSTVSVPEVSLVPSPEVTKVGSPFKYHIFSVLLIFNPSKNTVISH